MSTRENGKIITIMIITVQKKEGQQIDKKLKMNFGEPNGRNSKS